MHDFLLHSFTSLGRNFRKHVIGVHTFLLLDDFSVRKLKKFQYMSYKNIITYAKWELSLQHIGPLNHTRKTVAKTTRKMCFLDQRPYFSSLDNAFQTDIPAIRDLDDLGWRSISNKTLAAFLWRCPSSQILPPVKRARCSLAVSP